MSRPSQLKGEKMKKTIAIFLALFLTAPFLYATPRGEGGSNDAAPVVAYGKTSGGAIVPLLVDTSGNLNTKLTTNSYVLLENKNGYGSGSTKIPRYTNNTTVGTDVTCTDDATLATVCTINTTGYYCGRTGGRSDGGAIVVGFSLNSTHLTANIDGGFSGGAASREILALGGTNGAFLGAGAQFCGNFTATDVIRPHHGGNLGTNTDKVEFVEISRVR